MERRKVVGVSGLLLCLLLPAGHSVMCRRYVGFTVQTSRLDSNVNESTLLGVGTE